MKSIANAGVAVAAIVAACIAWHMPAATAHAQAINTTRGVEDTLREQLKLGLKARREIEFKYIESVAKSVENKTLPLELVRSTFLWARKKKPYPFQYFQRGLRIRASKAGFTAP